MTRTHSERTSELGPLVVLVASRMRVDPEDDPRRETIVAAMSGVASDAYQPWVDRAVTATRPTTSALRSSREDGFSTLDQLEVGR